MLSAPSPRWVVEALVRLDGTVSLGDAYSVANAVGIDDQALRLAIRRLVAEEAFVQHGRGRAGTLIRTTSADLRERHDAEFVALAFALDAGDVEWDGAWHLLGVTIPENRRPLRDKLRRTLLRFGAGRLPGGLYVSPHPWRSHVLAEFPELGELPSVMFARSDSLTLGPLSDPAEIAAEIWDLSSLADVHARLLTLAEEADPSPTRISGLARALQLGHAFELAHAEDPLLPPALLPEGWIGSRSRAAFTASWAAVMAALPEQDRLFARFSNSFPTP